jgi:hypothetical protein
MGVGIKSEAQGAPHASRRAFEHDVQPWKAVTIDVPLGPLAQPGRYVATISVLQEGVAWFGRPVTLGIVVADDAPH